MITKNRSLTTDCIIKKRFADNELVCEKVIGIFHIISNKIRFRILCLLTEGDFCVNETVDFINCGKISNISQQLKLMTMAGILEKRRDKKQIFYHLKDEKIRGIIRFLQEQFMQGKAS